ncbi:MULTISPECIES: serine hydrolase domain-containing protein [Providencia]|uniref:Beta-lactamase family protein n=1 Tax=Providencia huaxiensis TaxID=2027290 RepID=A0ABU2ITD7_9GAMM|nr:MULTISPECIES: serine hydrolase domain-containing protein [Providencia]MBZ3681014.1 beta-lactamase family protein [Providencia rettgeri]MDT0132052.1 beta-lactamase family protein [Providencia huaxiensis]MDT1978458.1 beta-lactamase family protein [Providencia huaxiensis]QLR01589.1 beta-lactamase family protein [Providencia rettgeri]
MTSSIQQLENLTCGVVLYYHNQSQNSVGTFCARGADLEGMPLTVDTPLRIASNTKTFTAATILRLAEMGKLSIYDAISEYIDPQYNALLSTQYNTHTITIRHLLEHSSGLLDHADGDYLKAVLKQPNYVWSRTEQVEMYMRKQFPTFSPSKSFIYSDTGYILLGDIIERITGQSLGLAVRELLHFDSIGLESAYWESLEQPPEIATPRARQYLGKWDGTHIHASMDAYGGGGLVMSSKQMAIFLEALFEGNIFSSPNTLETMLSMGSHDGAENYRLGIMVNVVNGITLYSHLGFWGSVAYYAPKAKISVAGFVDDRESRETLIHVIESLLSQQHEMKR